MAVSCRPDTALIISYHTYSVPLRIILQFVSSLYRDTISGNNVLCAEVSTATKDAACPVLFLERESRTYVLSKGDELRFATMLSLTNAEACQPDSRDHHCRRKYDAISMIATNSGT